MTSSRLIIQTVVPGNKVLRSVTMATSGMSSRWNSFWFLIHTMTPVSNTQRQFNFSKSAELNQNIKECVCACVCVCVYVCMCVCVRLVEDVWQLLSRSDETHPQQHADQTDWGQQVFSIKLRNEWMNEQWTSDFSPVEECRCVQQKEWQHHPLCLSGGRWSGQKSVISPSGGVTPMSRRERWSNGDVSFQFLFLKRNLEQRQRLIMWLCCDFLSHLFVDVL